MFILDDEILRQFGQMPIGKQIIPSANRTQRDRFRFAIIFRLGGIQSFDGSINAAAAALGADESLLMLVQLSMQCWLGLVPGLKH